MLRQVNEITFSICMYNYRWYTADGMFPGGKNATLIYLKKPPTHNQNTLETKNMTLR